MRSRAAKRSKKDVMTVTSWLPSTRVQHGHPGPQVLVRMDGSLWWRLDLFAPLPDAEG
jgi:hypothetical protein